jgi:hypothetical protein
MTMLHIREVIAFIDEIGDQQAVPERTHDQVVLAG